MRKSEEKTMVMLFPEYSNNYIPSKWAIELSYDYEGQVKEMMQKTLNTINCSKPCKKKPVRAANREQKRDMMPEALVSWAFQPYYD